MNDLPLITILTLSPLIGGILILIVGASNAGRARMVAAVACLVSFLLALILWLNFDTSQAGLQFVELHSWIPSLDIDYFVGIDGLGLLMVLLTALIVPMALFAAGLKETQPPLFYSLVLFLQCGLFGTFTALNFFHWFIFWELSLIPAFFLIKLWGGPQRGPAATQFFIYTMVGSIAMLLGFLALYLATGKFDFQELAEIASTGGLDSRLSEGIQWLGMSPGQVSMIVFFGIFLGFAVKVPLMPFHTWLPSAYAEAPSTVTMLLTGAMSKMGVYGFVRILLPLFPDEMRAMLKLLLWLAVITIIFSACAAFAQKDLKRMLAYSSINHLGYCLLGIFAVASLKENTPQWAVEKSAALNGVFLQMFNHGLVAATLFCFVSFLESRSDGQRGLHDFGGLRKIVPVFCGLMGIATFASIGLPGLNGFVGEFLIFKGVFALAPWAAALSVIGLLVTAVFLLTFLQRVFHGPLNEHWKSMPDLSGKERWIVAPAIALMFVIGIYPQFIVKLTNRTVMQLVEQLTQ